MRIVLPMDPTALRNRRILVVAPPSRFDEAAFYQAWQLLADDGAWLVLASDSRTGVAVGEEGAVEPTSLGLGVVAAREFDAVLVVGSAAGPESLLGLRGFRPLIVDAAAAGIPVAAIGKCAAEAVRKAGAAPIAGTLAMLTRVLAELAVVLRGRPPVEAAAEARV